MAKKTSIHTQPLKIPEIIILTAQLIAFISPKLVTLFAAKLFTTPIKHKIPKRELAMDHKSLQKKIFIPTINKEIIMYQYGTTAKKILLVHGWSGRGTQLYKIADELLNIGYSTISFDAPGHGKSPGKMSIMTDFISIILEINKQEGPFEVAIGHSLGGMSVLNAIKKGLQVDKAIIIGSGDIVEDIMDDFIKKLKLKPAISTSMRLHFEDKYKEEMNSYSAYIAASKIQIPVLVLHDHDDPEVPVKAGINIHNHLENGELILTKGLGHRKILGSEIVLKKIIDFITK
ncbi:pimeloyl-ACP methyl ester carboxylesterase [Flavobacterium sp. PL11]|uniref:alpha/beta hydrolase n=1 Tax=Flavobacterium sp. PL11 TaxID=3071717 RepID=UPI002DFF30FC|nr:pimeloyl-ACP methyl ester carboxylesterase [Flavobacterium sp. PL11]